MLFFFLNVYVISNGSLFSYHISELLNETKKAIEKNKCDECHCVYTYTTLYMELTLVTQKKTEKHSADFIISCVSVWLC